MAQFIEGAARFRIDKVHQDYAFYGYPPFNVQGGEFDRFVTALHRAIEELRPQREHMQRSYRFLEAGDVGGAMKSAAESQIHAHAIQLQENNNAVIQGTTKAVMQQLVPLLGNTVQSLGGQNAAALFTSLATESSAGALTQSQTSAPSPHPAQKIDPKDPSTWPDDPPWIVHRRPLLTLNKNPRTLVDLYNDWNFGYLNWPALRHLEEKYPRGKWRLRRVSFRQDVARIRLINSLMNTRLTQRHFIESSVSTSNSMNRVEDLSTCSGRSCGNFSIRYCARAPQVSHSVRRTAVSDERPCKPRPPPPPLRQRSETLTAGLRRCAGTVDTVVKNRKY